MPATVIVGAQWGDEGKGKIVDLLAQHSDLVCRYQGGPNAGHTIVVDGETFKIRQMPSGIVRGKECVIGAGCVVDPAVFVDELDDAGARAAIPPERIHLSGNAHLIMPWHVALDGGASGGSASSRSARPGAGSALRMRTRRRGIGIRVQDLLDPKILRQKIEVALAEKNVWLERVYEIEPFELDEVAEQLRGHAKRLRPYVADTSLLVDRALRDGKHVLFEGAQGTLLDLDHGTYPFVTSSNPIAGGRRRASGSGRSGSTRSLGVAKAYVTRVGEGPFPTEIEGPIRSGCGARRRVRDGDGPRAALRLARPGRAPLRGAVNGITSLALTKLDVLSDFAEIPVCVRYRLRDGSETASSRRTRATSTTPAGVRGLPGWREPLDGSTSRRTPGAPPAATSSSSSTSSTWRSTLVGTGPSASASSRGAAARRARALRVERHVAGPGDQRSSRHRSRGVRGRRSVLTLTSSARVGSRCATSSSASGSRRGMIAPLARALCDAG